LPDQLAFGAPHRPPTNPPRPPCRYNAFKLPDANIARAGGVPENSLNPRLTHARHRPTPRPSIFRRGIAGIHIAIGALCSNPNPFT